MRVVQTAAPIVQSPPRAQKTRTNTTGDGRRLNNWVCPHHGGRPQQNPPSALPKKNPAFCPNPRSERPAGLEPTWRPRRPAQRLCPLARSLCRRAAGGSVGQLGGSVGRLGSSVRANSAAPPARSAVLPAVWPTCARHQLGGCSGRPARRLRRRSVGGSTGNIDSSSRRLAGRRTTAGSPAPLTSQAAGGSAMPALRLCHRRPVRRLRTRQFGGLALLLGGRPRRPARRPCPPAA